VGLSSRSSSAPLSWAPLVPKTEGVPVLSKDPLADPDGESGRARLGTGREANA
jgi:hypothetical protein